MAFRPDKGGPALISVAAWRQAALDAQAVVEEDAAVDSRATTVLPALDEVLEGVRLEDVDKVIAAAIEDALTVWPAPVRLPYVPDSCAPPPEALALLSPEKELLQARALFSEEMEATALAIAAEEGLVSRKRKPTKPSNALAVRRDELEAKIGDEFEAGGECVESSAAAGEGAAPEAPAAAAAAAAAAQLAAGEVVLCVQLKSEEGGKPVQEWQLFGNQTLAQLRDVLYCAADHTGVHAPRLRSSFFLIEDTFYCDMRDGDAAIDLSLPLRQELEVVAARRRRGSGGARPPQRKPMETTKLLHLQLRLGVPYTYVHQLDCAHCIVFTDLRLLSAADCRNTAYYPLQLFQAPIRKRKCQVCNIASATKASVGDPLADATPLLLCDACEQLLHRDKDGQLVSTAKTCAIYPYLHD